MKKMILTENEIIKALERMSEEDQNGFSSDILGVINRQKAEIERLQKAIKVQDIMIEQQDYEIKKAKSEARKELAERLKEHKHECGCNYRKKPVYAVTEEKIDNLLAEMEERE